MLTTDKFEIYDPEVDACRGCADVPAAAGAHYHSPTRGILFQKDFPPPERVSPWVQVRVINNG